MIIIQDTREKVGKHKNIERYCRLHKIALQRLKLDVGDYMLGEEENGEFRPRGQVSVDIKGGGLLELANDLTRDHQKLDRKYKRCLENKIKLFVIVEEPIITSINEVSDWSHPYGGISGRKLYDYIFRLTLSYGVKFIFCSKSNSPKTIIKILQGELQ